MFLTIILLLLWLVILIGSADALVKWASSISAKAWIPPIVIWLTIVAFWTSAPELIINIYSTMKWSTDIAIWNIIWSNISNILLILWVSTMITTLKIQRNTTWKEIPFALLSVIVLFVMANDIQINWAASNEISRTDWLILLWYFMIFMFYTFWLYKKGQDKDWDEEIKIYSYQVALLLSFAWLTWLFLWWQLLVDQAVILAKMAWMSEILIGLTIVAIWTSLPELATSVIAAKKWQTDIAIWNIIWSNIFNVFWILWITWSIRSLPVSKSAYEDIFFNVLITLFLFLSMFMWKKHTLKKWQGWIFIFLYIAYTLYIINRW